MILDSTGLGGILTLTSKNRNPELAVQQNIFMTSYGSERNAVEATKFGALDHTVKSSESMTDMPHIAERAIQQWNLTSPFC